MRHCHCWEKVAEVIRMGLGVFLLVSGLGYAAAMEGEKWTDQLKFAGDLRLRHESIIRKTAGQKDRDRERMRLRFGVKAAIQDFLVGARLASGTGEQTSTNQTFANSFSQKGIYIDQAYLQWKAQEWLSLAGGRMPNPFWTTTASDIVWDSDINPEGYAQQIAFPLGDRLNVFGNFGQFMLNENSSIEADPLLLANQIGLKVRLTEDVRVTLAGSYYGFDNEKLASLAPPAQQYGNTRVSTSSAQLATSFDLAIFTGEVTFHAGRLPVAIQGDFVRNMQDKTNLGSEGYQVGTILGRAKNQGDMEVGYFYKYLQNNATLADLADSDWGASGGTNRRGHSVWWAMALRDYVQLKAKYMTTRVINPMLNSSGRAVSSPSYDDVNRLQVDLSIKF